MKFTAAITFLFASGVSGFATLPSNQQSSLTSLNMINEEGMKKAAVTAVAAVFLMGNAAFVPSALAMDDIDFGSSQVIAGRSGGRAGGRSSAARSPSMSRSSSSSSSTRVIERRTTIVQPSYSSPTVIVAPPVYGYNPMPGLGLSMGMNAVSQIGNDMRDYRQEGEIRSTQAELQQSKMREAEMEARLRQLEMKTNSQQMSQQQLMMQQQMMQQAK